MKTVEAAKGHWAMIFEHYGLPPITGKNHFKGSARCVIRLESSASITATAREHGSAPAAAVTGLSWLPKPRANHSTRFAAKSMH
jgi:hypothetical protein